MAQTHGDPPQKGQVSRLAQARRKRRNKQIRRGVLIAALVLVVLVWLTGAYSSSLAMAQDLLESMQISLWKGEGFPVKTNIDEIYQVEPLAGGFVELGKSDLVVYSPSGRLLRSVQHGYSRPAISFGARRFCLYSRAGTEVRIEGRTKTLDTLSLEKPVLFCSMAQNGTVAAVTRSGRYAAELRVYDPSLRFIFGWNPTDAEGTPTRVAFAPDNHNMSVACIRAENGSIGSSIYWLDTHKSEVQASVWVPNGMILQLQWLGGDKVLAVFDGFTALYDADDGQELARFDHSGSALMAAHTAGRNTALLLADGPKGQYSRIVLLDHNLQLLGQALVQPDAFDVVCTRTAAYSLSQGAIRGYSLAGELQWQQEYEHPIKAVVQAKELLAFSAGQAWKLEPPSEEKPPSDEAAPRSHPQEDLASQQGGPKQESAPPESE